MINPLDQNQTNNLIRPNLPTPHKFQDSSNKLKISQIREMSCKIQSNFKTKSTKG